MESNWSQADAFPIIARLIQQAYREQHDFITAPEIAKRLLADMEGRHLIEVAVDQGKQKHSVEWTAANMVSWFSQRITVGASNWSRAFDRTKVGSSWAYRPSAD